MAISGSNDCDELNRGIGNAVAHGDYVLAALRRIKRFERFVEHQRHRREWLNFREIADWLARRENAVVPDKVVRSGAYDLLRDDLLAGDFEEGGKSKVLYLHHRSAVARMTRQQLLAAIEVPTTGSDPDGIIRSEYLAHCWMPRRMFERWLSKHEPPPSPARFEPQEAGRGVNLPPPRRKPGAKPKIPVLKEFISKHYPNPVPANVTAKMIANEFESSDGGFPVSLRTVRRALGGK